MSFLRGNELENDKVLSQYLQENVRQSQAAKNPSAEDLVEKTEVRRIVYK